MSAPAFPERTGLTIYGADWCPHCRAAKDDLAKFNATFVDCTQNQAECDHKQIQGIPKVVNGEKTVQGWPNKGGDTSSFLAQLGLN